MRTATFILLLWIIFSGCRNEGSAETVTLRLKYKKGDTESFLMKTETDGGFMKVSYEVNVKFVVAEVEKDTLYNLMLDVLDLKSEEEMDGEKESYNSAKPQNEMTPAEKEMDAAFRSVLNDTVLFTVSDKGRATPMRLSSGRLITPDNQPVDFSDLQIIFPNKPISVGEEWTTEKINPLLDNKITSTYKLRKVSDDMVFIDVTAKVGGIKNVLKENRMTGEYQISRKEGRLRKSLMTMPLQSVGGGGKVTYTIIAL